MGPSELFLVEMPKEREPTGGNREAVERSVRFSGGSGICGSTGKEIFLSESSL